MGRVEEKRKHLCVRYTNLGAHGAAALPQCVNKVVAEREHGHLGDSSGKHLCTFTHRKRRLFAVNCITAARTNHRLLENLYG